MTDVKNLTLVEKTADSLTVGWSYKKDNDTIFIIKWFEGEALIGKVTVNAARKKYKIDNLDSCTTYKITLITSEDFDRKQISILETTSLTRKQFCRSHFFIKII